MTTNQTWGIGNDVEFFVKDRATKKIVSAIPVLKCDKYDPIDLGDSVRLYADCTLAEVAYKPYYSKEEMFDRITGVLKKIQNHLGDRYELVAKAAHVYDNQELKDPKAHEIGCGANFDGWRVCQNENDGKFKNNLRSAGFHIHVSSKDGSLKDFDTRINAIRVMDSILGCSSVIFDDDKTAIKRRAIYGKAAEHRITQYPDGSSGFEYRVLSPSVLNSKEKTDLSFELINYSISHIQNKTLDEVLKLIKPENVINAINSCNKKLAKKVLTTIGLPKDLMKRVNKKYKKENLYKSWDI